MMRHAGLIVRLSRQLGSINAVELAGRVGIQPLGTIAV
jgi:hypothetical protein